MRWNHLPVSGGLYDQHPKLLEEFEVIFVAKASYERQQAEDAKRNQKAGKRR